MLYGLVIPQRKAASTKKTATASFLELSTSKMGFFERSDKAAPTAMANGWARYGKNLNPSSGFARVVHVKSTLFKAKSMASFWLSMNIGKAQKRSMRFQLGYFEPAF